MPIDADLTNWNKENAWPRLSVSPPDETLADIVAADEEQQENMIQQQTTELAKAKLKRREESTADGIAVVVDQKKVQKEGSRKRIRVAEEEEKKQLDGLLELCRWYERGNHTTKNDMRTTMSWLQESEASNFCLSFATSDESTTATMNKATAVEKRVGARVVLGELLNHSLSPFRSHQCTEEVEEHNFCSWSRLDNIPV